MDDIVVYVENPKAFTDNHQNKLLTKFFLFKINIQNFTIIATNRKINVSKVIIYKV